VLSLAIGVWITWPPYYRQGPIQARVVDRVTGEPIAGVSVVAEWDVTSIPFGVDSLYQFNEATTNADGLFSFAAWGPRRRPINGYLTDHDPEIWIYKFGYEALRLDNSSAYVPVIGRPDASGKNVWTPAHTPRSDQVAEKYPGWRYAGIRRYSFWNGKTIGMTRTHSGEEDARALAFVQTVDVTVDKHAVPMFWRAWQSALQRLPPSAFEKYPSLSMYLEPPTSQESRP